jgi:hypothetical protein
MMGPKYEEGQSGIDVKTLFYEIIIHNKYDHTPLQLTSMCVLCTKLWVKILSLLESDGPVTPKFLIDGFADRVSTNFSAQLGVTMTVSSLTCQGKEEKG